jgi:hypothetical protein
MARKADPVTDHDELLARVDDWNGHHARGLTADLIRDLAGALRAALATRAQPLFEGKFKGWQHESIVALVRWDGDPRCDLPTEPTYGQRVVVYASSGSATPTTEDTSGPRQDTERAALRAVGEGPWTAVAGSATPTQENE